MKQTIAFRVPHIHASVIHAWAEGATVQYRNPKDSADPRRGWVTVEQPAWYSFKEYRVQPIESVDQSGVNYDYTE